MNMQLSLRLNSYCGVFDAKNGQLIGAGNHDMVSYARQSDFAMIAVNVSSTSVYSNPLDLLPDEADRGDPDADEENRRS